ncbi:MAG: amidohydrolase family protein, partial [Pyrinomonadaceae bacterium]
MIEFLRRIVWFTVACGFLIIFTCQNCRLYATQNAAQKQKVSMIITGGVLVTMDTNRRVFDDGAVAIKDDRIVDVGSSSEIMDRYDAPIKLDARGGAIIPGLINGHTHVPMTLFRGISDDLDLNDWLSKFIFPAEAKNVTENFVRLGAQLGLAEMIRGGTTTYCDMYYFEDAIADETARAGVRGVLGETVIDFPVADNKRPADALRYSERFIKKWQGHTLITPAVAPHSPYTVAKENLLATHALSERLKAPVLIHVTESQK